MIKKTRWLIFVVLAVISFVFGYVIAYVNIGSVGSSSVSVGPNTYQAGWDAAKQRLVDSGTIPSAGMNLEVRAVSGEITAIEGDKITLKIRPLEPLADPSLDTRTITVDSNTKITSMVPKDQKEFATEMEAYSKKMSANINVVPNTTKIGSTSTPAVPSAPITPPESFTKTTISVSDLQVGQTINVTTGNDIKNNKEFSATEITYYAPMTPTNIPVPAPAPAQTNAPAAPLPTPTNIPAAPLQTPVVVPAK